MPSIIYSFGKFLFDEVTDSRYNKSHSAKASQEALKNLEQKTGIQSILQNVGLAQQDFNNDGLKDYEKIRIKGHEAFSVVKDHQGNPIGERLEKPVRDKLKNSFEKSKELTTAIEEYRQSQQAFNELCQDIGKTYSAQDLIKSYKQYGSKAQNAQLEQQTKEKNNLTTLFKDESFITSLTKSLNITDDKDKNIATVKDNMLAKLDEKHKEEKEKLNKTINENESLLNKAANKKQNMRIFIANQIKYGHTQMRKKALALLKQIEDKNQETASMQVGGEADLDFEGISLEYFTKTRKGRDITKVADGTYEIKFKDRWSLDAFFYLNPFHSVRAEIRDLVDLIKAAGYEGIIMKVTFKDKDETAMKRAKDCAKAALEAGFAPDKIKIFINGESTELGKILNSSELEYYGLLQQEAAKLYEPTPIPKGAEQATNAMRDRIDKMKKTNEDAQEPTPSTGPGV